MRVNEIAQKVNSATESDNPETMSEGFKSMSDVLTKGLLRAGVNFREIDVTTTAQFESLVAMIKDAQSITQIFLKQAMTKFEVVDENVSKIDGRAGIIGQEVLQITV